MTAIQKGNCEMICLTVLLVLTLCAPAQENPASMRFEQSIHVVANVKGITAVVSRSG
jgi:hypothetical protein